MVQPFPGKRRFTIAQTPEGEVLTIPARRYPFLIVFQSIWLAGWIAMGLAILVDFQERQHWFTLIWLLGWMLGVIVVALMLLWMLTGRETLRVNGEELEVTTSIFGFRRTRTFFGASIRDVVMVPGAAITKGRQVPPMPVLSVSRGSVLFTYDGQNRSLAYGVADAEAREIAEWLRKHLPKSAG